MFIQVFKKAFLICSLCLNQYPILNKIPEKEGISLPVQKLEAYPKVETSNLVKKKPKKKVEFNKYQLIADTAKAQIGVYQDCTMLVTNSLAVVGIYFHG